MTATLVVWLVAIPALVLGISLVKAKRKPKVSALGVHIANASHNPSALD